MHYTAEPELAAFVAALPKTETHLHLEGSVSFEQLHAFDPDRYSEPPPFWQPDYRFNGFDHFQSLFEEWVIPYHSSLEHYSETAHNVFKRCRAQGCRYVETSFHLPALARMNANGPELLEAIIKEAPPGLEVRVFGGFTRIDYEEHGELLENALGWERLTGIDLHGPENLPIDERLPDYWRRAKECGKVTKAHAGEFMPASSVDWIVDNLEVDRIQHGVRASESSAVVEKLATGGVTLDVCPISNLKLGVEGITTMAEHPIRNLIDAGVCVTVSTDDTFMFGNTLVEEYYALVQELNFTRAELIQVARNGVRVSLLEDSCKQDLDAELDALM